MEKVLIGKGTEKVYLLANKANQHGMIAGATGTGKTVTLKVLAEQFSRMGVPCILSDVKGDLINISQPGVENENVKSRVETIDMEDFSVEGFPTQVWDVYGEKGMPLRVTISEMGPTFLGRIMELNDTQVAVLNAAFRVADENGLLLIDTKDLRSLLNELLENKEDYSKLYGSIAPQTVHAILRKLVYLEDLGGTNFFGETSIEMEDMIKTDSNGRGMVNILAASKLINNPVLYSMFLLYLLSELFETLPEVGNPEKPKLVFFFDEAHLLFESCPKSLQEKIEQLVRLIRSKGVGVYFITQNPLDIPSDIAGQLGNRIIHGLRAFTPKDQKAINGIAETFRANPNLDTKEAIVSLGTGEALVSVLDESGAPTMAERVLICPPRSTFDPLNESQWNGLVESSPLYGKYKEAVDPESAYEILERNIALRQREKELEEKEKLLEKENKKSRGRKNSQQDLLGKSMNSFLGTMSRAIGREIARNVLGSLKRR
ncbi:DUF853 domain-containing protein [Peptoniphilus sp. KCTC 25270]|uniref:helicase HerA-like domain-containing protein n=1 Tax=Peptoniphilus sp. KCTC 25270 TaxID=2897414 RepID=UPI001E2FF2F5|nr:helicase HerA-like domain-containing protein [Peptoniphilus sp. KCTC 25270]MCD1147689.1 DUF853 domain-containing protein [Peptoniphilus sp. KCTC 25270]